MYLCLCYRPAQIFWDCRLKLHGEVWAKFCLDTNFQPIQKSFDHVYEAPKVRRAVRISPTRGPSEPLWRGQTTFELAENWCPGGIWPKLHRGVWGRNPKKVWAGLLSNIIICNPKNKDNTRKLNDAETIGWYCYFEHTAALYKLQGLGMLAILLPLASLFQIVLIANTYNNNHQLLVL